MCGIFNWHLVCYFLLFCKYYSENSLCNRHDLHLICLSLSEKQIAVDQFHIVINKLFSNRSNAFTHLNSNYFEAKVLSKRKDSVTRNEFSPFIGKADKSEAIARDGKR